jgi:hypothetical protein
MSAPWHIPQWHCSECDKHFAEDELDEGGVEDSMLCKDCFKEDKLAHDQEQWTGPRPIRLEEVTKAQEEAWERDDELKKERLNEFMQDYKGNPDA